MLFTPVLFFVTVLIIYLVSSPLSRAPVSKDPSICSVVEYSLAPGKPRLSLFTGDGMFCTPVSLFVIVLMIYSVSSSLTHAPYPKDPSVHSVVEYTREAEIESAY